MKTTDTLIICIPFRWPSNLKRAVTVLVDSPGNGTLRKEVREISSLPGHAAMVSFRPLGHLPLPPKAALPDGRDTYQWTSAEGTMVICGSNTRSAAFAVFEILRRLGLRWLTLTRDPKYAPELAEPIPGRYRWQAAFPSTVVQLSPRHHGYEGINQIERQCRWLLFCHWNTYWCPNVEVFPSVGKLVQSFGLEYEAGGHDLNKTMPRHYFAERPDFFPVVRGKRTAEVGDFALGNPEAEQVVRRKAADIFRRYRDAQGLHLWYDDIWFGAEDEATPASWSATRRASEELRLVSGIHRRVVPGQRLITLAYNGQVIPDRTAHFDPQVKVLFCARERCQVHPLDGCGCNREYMQILKQWVDLLGPERVFYLDYSLDHYISVSTLRVHPSGEVLAADMQTLTKMKLGALHTLYFPDFSDVECALLSYSLMHAVARPFECDPARLKNEFFRMVFGPHENIARNLYDLYVPVQAAFLRYDDYRGRKRDMRFAGLDQTRPSLRHARLLTTALKNHGRKLQEALRSVDLPSIETAPGRELYRMVKTLRFSLRGFSLAAAMLEGVPYIRGESRTPSARKAWLRARAELAQLKPEVQALNADPFAAGTWSRDWLAGWSVQMERCLQYGKVDERD